MSSYIKMWSRDEHRELTEPIQLINSVLGYKSGVGRILHIEQPGPFSYERARAHATEWVSESENLLGPDALFVVRQVGWIGTPAPGFQAYDVGSPKVGQFVFFNDGMAGPVSQPLTFRRFLRDREAHLQKLIQQEDQRDSHTDLSTHPQKNLEIEP